MHQIDSWGGFGMMFFWWILLAVAVVALFTWIARQNSTPQKKSALDLLKERYVKGEISKKEYEEMKNDISD